MCISNEFNALLMARGVSPALKIYSSLFLANFPSKAAPASCPITALKWPTQNKKDDRWFTFNVKLRHRQRVGDELPACNPTTAFPMVDRFFGAFPDPRPI